MRADIDALLDILDAARVKLRDLQAQAGNYEYPHGVHAQVDLGHAEHRVKEAIHYVNRLVVNGRKPWDEEVKL